MTDALPIMRADLVLYLSGRSEKPDVPAVLPPNTDYWPSSMAGAPRERCLVVRCRLVMFGRHRHPIVAYAGGPVSTIWCVCGVAAPL
jgi:hypothetical protein